MSTLVSCIRALVAILPRPHLFLYIIRLSELYRNHSVFRRPFIPKVLYFEGPVYDGSMFRNHEVLCSEGSIIEVYIYFYGSMFRRFYLPMVLCSDADGSMFRRFYVLKVLCSEGSMFQSFYVLMVLCSEVSMFRRFYVPKVLCSEGSMYQRLYVPKDACSEGSMF